MWDALARNQEYLSVHEGQEGPVCAEKTYTVTEDRPVQKERRTLVRPLHMRPVGPGSSLVWQLSKTGAAACCRVALHAFARSWIVG